jgi:hypothetical protein
LRVIQELKRKKLIDLLEENKGDHMKVKKLKKILFYSDDIVKKEIE